MTSDKKMPTITFGTSGWRAFLADDFTIPNVRIAVQAIAEHLQGSGHASKGVLLAYDPRFLGPRFCEVAAEVLAGHGIASVITVRDTPTPADTSTPSHTQASSATPPTLAHSPMHRIMSTTPSRVIGSLQPARIIRRSARRSKQNSTISGRRVAVLIRCDYPFMSRE